MSLTDWNRVLLIGALIALSIGGIVMTTNVVSTAKEASALSAHNAWIATANSVLESTYGFRLPEANAGALIGDFTCSRAAAKPTGESELDQYTYCQNSGTPVKVSLAWKHDDTEKKVVLERIANTVSRYAEKQGSYICREDDAFNSHASLGGVLSDCVITMDDGSIYHASAYFFYPKRDTRLSQVLYAYSLTPNTDGEVRKTVRTLAEGIEEVEPLSGNWFISVAYAQDGGGGDGGGGDGGGGDGGGDGGAGCGCDGGGNSGGDAGGGGTSPGDYGPGGEPTFPPPGGGPNDENGNPINFAPYVNAGPDIRIKLSQTSVNISGASTYDIDGPMPSVRWLKAAGPASTVTNGATLHPTMSNFASIGTYTYILVATDNYGLSNSDSMKIIVESDDTGTNDPSDPSDPGDGGGGDGPGDGDDSDPSDPGSGGGFGPDLRSDKLIVHANDPVKLDWDTNNNDEGLCMLTGGTLGNSYNPIPRVGDIETGTETTLVVGRTTYILTCGLLHDQVTIEVIGAIKES